MMKLGEMKFFIFFSSFKLKTPKGRVIVNCAGFIFERTFFKLKCHKNRVRHIIGRVDAKRRPRWLEAKLWVIVWMTKQDTGGIPGFSAFF